MAIVLVAAKLGGELAERLGQPAVLGELLAGVLLGNATLAGVNAFESLKHNSGLELMAEIGVILLLFQVGVESTVHELMAVGARAAIVAVVGVIAPMVLGVGVTAALLPGEPWYVHLFAGATLTATSVGITARVLRDLRRTDTTEARIILGAAVADDVLGLIVLAVVSGMVTSMAGGGGARVEAGPVAIIVMKAVAFLVGAIVLGRWIHVRVLEIAKRFRVDGITLALAVSYCFAMAVLANALGLAPIVGAFAAGLVLEDDDYEEFQARGVRPISELIQPLATIFVPMFFVLMGITVDLSVFGSPRVLMLAGVLTLAAFAGKQVCGLVAGSGLNRLAIGIGMIPRGEVGLIFASMGAALEVGGAPVLSPALVSAMIVMVMLTTMMTPPLLKWSFERGSRSSRG
ncbi:MAG: cation:proton antiporter [Bryobacteraceae bacterium]